MALIHELAETAAELLEQLQTGMALQAQERLEALLDRVQALDTPSRVPQLLVTLSPQGELLVEAPTNGGIRRQVELDQQLAGIRLQRMLSEQKKRIDGEAAEARRRVVKQPNWRLIAKHPQVEIREILVQQCPQGPGLQTSYAKKSLEDMGL